MYWPRFFPLACLAALMLGGCSSLSSLGLTGEAENFAAGSALAPRLASGDREALGGAVVAAVESGQPQRWRGARAAGVVMPGGYSIANLRADPNARIALARDDIDVGYMMETELGLYVLTRNSNVRIGPGTQYAIAEKLPAGTGVEIVGRLTDGTWMLAAIDGAVRGYIHKSLAIKAPGTELLLAGGPRRRPIRCREFTQRISIFSEQDEWADAACHDGAAWRRARPVAAPPIANDDLAGL
jgi:SH3 domain-containing protein